MSQNELLSLTKLLHILIKNGKKAKALRIFLILLKNLKEAKLKNLTSIDVIQQSLANARPILNVKKERKSSKIFYLPTVIGIEKRTKIALH